MVIQSVAVCASLIVALVGNAGQGTSGAFSGAFSTHSGTRYDVAATSPWDNPNANASKPSGTAKKKPKPATTSAPTKSGGKSSGKAVQAEEEDESPPPPQRRRKPLIDESSNDEADKEEDAPKPKRRVLHKKDDEDEEEVDEDEEDDDDGPMEVMPVLLPRLVSLQLGISAFGRSFRFNTPLQNENSFPRIGGSVSLETYPLLLMSGGFYRRFGIGVVYERESGQAAVPQTNGSTVSFPVVQTRWHFDVRYPFNLGERVVVIPALGYGFSSFDLRRTPPVNPSMCPAGTADACLPDITLSNLVADLHVRIAANESLSFSLNGGYLLGLSVNRSIGTIGGEAAPTVAGYHAELGSTFLLTSWLGLFGRLSYVHYGYTFTGAAYKSAAETYYGGIVGVTVFTK